MGKRLIFHYLRSEKPGLTVIAREKSRRQRAGRGILQKRYRMEEAFGETPARAGPFRRP